jgi:hypothetical protein
MTDDALRRRLADLDQVPLEEHADVLDEVHEHIVGELDELRRAVPGAADPSRPR